MSRAMSGIRVIEVAAWTFVPAAGAVLADWGADVIKVEHPETGDPQRGLISMGLIPGGAERGELHHRAAQPGQAQHRPRHLAPTDGRELLYKLVETADVFLTSFLPDGAPEAADRRRAHPGGQPEHRLRPGLRPGRARAPTPARAATTARPYWARGGVADALTPGRRRVADRRPAPRSATCPAA